MIGVTSQGLTPSRGALPAILSVAAVAAVAALVASGVLAGCQRVPTLANTFASPEEVARAVVSGLTARDVDRLAALALTEDEFRWLVWPKLPTSRPGRNIPWDYAWNDLRTKSVMQLQARVHEWEDRGYTLVRIDFKGETTDYETFVVRRDSVVTLRDRDGRESQGRLFGSIIEQRGRFKVFSYVVD